MGDDVTNIIITEPEPTTEEDNIEEIGEQLLARLDEIDRQNGELNARIASLESFVAELAGREYAERDHTHEGFAPAEHTHDYAEREHEHKTEGPFPQREPDKPPEKQHPYFRKLNDF